jgi:glycolate oxidase
MYNKVNDVIVKKLAVIAGEKNLITDREKMLDYSHDEFSLEDIRNFPEVVVKPGDTRQVSEIMKLCAGENIPLTPRGAGTGLCGGCVPRFGGIVMSFERMNRIIEIDEENLLATAEAGASLRDFYEAVEKKGLFFPPHPGDESATIAGMIATNAGGARAVKYGVIRNFVRGIEVVMPDGEIVEAGGKFLKNSSGYSLLHLLVGSEGTLGIITRAIIALQAPPAAMYTLVVPYHELGDAIRTVPRIIRGKILPMAVEFIEKKPIEVSEDFLDRKWPCKEGAAHLMIIIDGASEDEVMKTAEAIGEICLENNAIDVFIADSKAKQQNVLDIRSHIYETIKNHMLEILDVSVSRARIADFVTAVHEIEKTSGIWLPVYGHAADGNVHVHLMKSTWEGGVWTEIPGWREKYRRVRDEIHALGKEYGGMVSGEHGIGLVKKEYLETFVGGRQVELMKGIKKVFDPGNVLNPGKVFDV